MGSKFSWGDGGMSNRLKSEICGKVAGIVSAAVILLAVAALGAGAIRSALAGKLSITPSISVIETFSDNVDLDPEGEESSALVTEVTPSLKIRSESARLTGALDALLTFRHQTAGTDKGINFDENAAGFGTAELLEDLFFLDAEASVSQQVLSSRETASASNQETVQTYGVSPYFKHRFGDIADAEVRYKFNQVLVDAKEDTVSDSSTHAAGFTIDSGSYFSRLLWSLDGSASEADRSDDGDISRQEIGLGLEYAVDRTFSIIGGGGYQRFDDGDPRNEFDGPTWEAGFRWRPGPRTELRATYGRRDDDESLAAKFRYDISSRTRFTARYSEVLETSQERLARNLSLIDLEGESDQLINEDTELLFDPNPSPFDIDDETTRIRAFQVRLDGSRGRNSFGVTANIEREEVEPTGEDQDVMGATVRFSRRLKPELNLDLFGGYENTKFDDGQKDNEFTVTAGLRYELYSNVQAGLSYGFRLQDSSDKASEFTENRGSVNLRVSF